MSDSNRKELVKKVSELVSRRFGGNYETAFRAYAQGDEKVDSNELRDLLYDADVGNGFTRGAWVDGIIRQLDGDNDGKISWQEFQSVMK